MAVGSASTGVSGPVEVNAVQSAFAAGNVPQVVLDDPTNGSVVVHLGGGGKTTPTIAVNTNAGTGATATLSTASDDLSGTITLTEGSGAWVVGTQCTVTFGAPHLLKTNVVLTPLTAATVAAAQAGTVLPYVTRTLAGFSIAFAVVDAGAHVYTWDYVVLGT